MAFHLTQEGKSKVILMFFQSLHDAAACCLSDLLPLLLPNTSPTSVSAIPVLLGPQTNHVSTSEPLYSVPPACNALLSKKHKLPTIFLTFFPQNVAFLESLPLISPYKTVLSYFPWSLHTLSCFVFLHNTYHNIAVS